MSLTIEKKEGSMAILTIERPAEELDKAITKAYQKVKSQISIPGFRKGKVPQQMVEKMYGKDIFYEDAAELIVNDVYPEEIENVEEIEIVSSPEINVVQLEKGKPFIFTAEVAVKPEVTLGQYKGLEYYKSDINVTEEEIDREIERTREMNSRRVPVEDRAAMNGDIVNIDFEGSVDGAAFDGGKAEGHSLTLGSGTFIPGFEEQIEGKNIGEEFDVNVTFPEDYQAENLKGKAAVFKCRLNDIKVKELPELDDEFAAEVSEFDTLEEYKADIRANMEKEKAANAKRVAEGELVKKAVENAQMEIPEPMVESEVYRTLNNFKQRLEGQGISMEQYMQITGSTTEKLVEEARPAALDSIKSNLVLEAIAAAENIEVSDEELEEEVKKMAEMYQMEYEKLSEMVNEKERKNMKKDIAASKAADLLYDNATAVDRPQEEAEETAEEKAE